MSDTYLEKVDNFATFRDVKSTLIQGGGGTPKVSVIVPTYKRSVLLSETLDSILAQKDYDDFEIVVVDNNPDRSDDTETLLERYADPRIAYFKNEKNIGMYANWNRAIEKSRGEWICMIHDDDLLLPSYLATVMSVVSKKPEIGLLVVDSEWRDMDLAKIRPLPKRSVSDCVAAFKRKMVDCYYQVFPLRRLRLADYILSYPHTTPGWFFRRDMALKVGGFELKYAPSADYYFSAKCCYYSRVYRYHRKLFVYRWGENAYLKLESRLGCIRNDHFFRLFLVDKLGLPLKKWSIYCVKIGAVIRTRLIVPEFTEEQIRDFLSSIGISSADVSPLKRWIYFHCLSHLFKLSLLLTGKHNELH